MASTGGKKNLKRQTSKQINFQTRNLLRVLDSGLINDIKYFTLIGLGFRKLGTGGVYFVALKQQSHIDKTDSILKIETLKILVL